MPQTWEGLGFGGRQGPLPRAATRAGCPLRFLCCGHGEKAISSGINLGLVKLNVYFEFVVVVVRRKALGGLSGLCFCRKGLGLGLSGIHGLGSRLRDYRLWRQSHTHKKLTASSTC